MSTTTATTAPKSTYVRGQGSGSSGGTTATPGSTANKPASGQKKYGLDVIVGHTPGTAFDIGSSSPITRDLGDVLQAIYQMPKGDVQKLQDRLIAAGLLSRKAITKGIADEDTVAAYEKLLLRASYGHKTPDTALNEAIAAGAPDLDASSSQRLPFSPQVSNPAEIKAALQTALQTDLGYVPPDAELGSLTALYQSLQVGAQRQTYDTATAGGTATEVVPIDVFAQQQAERLHPSDVHVKRLANAAKIFQAVVGQTAPATASF